MSSRGKLFMMVGGWLSVWLLAAILSVLAEKQLFLTLDNEIAKK